MRALRLASLQARAIAGDPYALAGAVLMTVSFAGNAALRLEHADHLRSMMTGVYAVLGPMVGVLGASGGLVPRSSGAVGLPALPVSGRDRAIASVLLGVLMLTVSSALGGLAVAGRPGVPFATHLLHMALLLLPGLVAGPGLGREPLKKTGVLAFLALAIAAARAGVLLTLAGSAAWAALSVAVLLAPLPTWSLSARADAGPLGRAGGSAIAALARLQLRGALLFGLGAGPLIVGGIASLPLFGFPPSRHAPLLVSALAAAAMPVWPAGWPRPFTGHAEVLARLPVPPRLALAGTLASWATVAVSAVLSTLVAWATIGRAVGMALHADPPAALAVVLAGGLVFRCFCARALLRAPVGHAP